MPRNITVTFSDGSTHVYRNAPDTVTPEQVSQRAQQDFGKQVKALDGGRKAAAPRQPAPRQSIGTTALNSLAAVGGSLFRGAAALPDMLADGGEAVNNGIQNALAAGLSMFGAEKAAQFVAPKPNPRRFRLGDIPDRMGTPRPVAPGVEMTGNIMGSMVVPVPAASKPGPKFPTTRAPTPASPAREIVQEGVRNNVRVMTSDVKPPQTFMAKQVQSLGEKIPLAGTGGQRVAQQAERVDAVRNLLTEYGGSDVTKLFDDAPTALDDVAKSLTTQRSQTLKTLKSAKTSVLTRYTEPVRTPQAIRAIDRAIARLDGIDSEAYAPVIEKLASTRRALASGKTLQQVEGQRRLLGAFFKDGTLANISDDGEKALQSIYGPLRSDMGNFIRAKGGASEFAKWQNADKQLAAMAGELRSTTMRNVLRTADMTPESVGRLLFSSNKSDVVRLYNNLDSFGRSRAQAAVLQRAFDAASNPKTGLSVETFVNNLTRMGDSVGVTFKGADRARVEGLAKLLNATRRAAESSVLPATGAQNTPFIAGYSIAQIFGRAAIPVTGFAGLVARAYESAPVRNALLQLGRTPAGSKAEAAMFRRAEAALSVWAANEGRAYIAHLNDNVGIPAAASDGQENQGEQQPPLQP